MTSTLRRSTFFPCLIASIAATALAQTAVQPPVVRVFHPSGAPVVYDVATIKPSDPSHPYSGSTLRHYIAGAYGVPIPWGFQATLFAGSQVVGGPAWIDKDRYDIKGKAPDDLQQSMRNMSEAERDARTETMQQSLLAERFHLKVHFETREMQLFEIVPGKSGLKIKPAASVDPDADKTAGSKDTIPPGNMDMMIQTNGVATLHGKSASMQMFLNALRGESPDVAGRPILDMTGFVGTFDITNFRFAGMPLPNAAAASANAGDPDVPSLSQALEQLGLKLVPGKGQVEVVVIDSIDRPTEN